MDIEAAWESTCKTIFGREIGELKNYESYLKEAVPGMEVKSAFSGESAFAASDDYAQGSEFYNCQKDQDKLSSLNTPFDLNAIKDMDSLIQATRERYVYSSNKLLGKCENVRNSDIVMDSINVLGSTNVTRCKNVAHCFLARDSQNVFGCASFGYDTNTVRSYYHKNNCRTFECAVEEQLSDALFCYNVFNSSDCLFCFNLRNKRNMIANIQLTKEQYASKKAALLEQITAELESKGRLDFSILNLMG